MTEHENTLRALGWGPEFQAQLSIEDLEACDPVRVAAVHRNGADVLGEAGAWRIETGPDLSSAEVAIGDWALVERSTGGLSRLLERKTLLQRRAAGTGRAAQLIAANVDTLLIVTSCNADFNIARLERYLAMARQAGVTPVIVLTKSDSCDDPEDYARRAAALAPMLAVETLDARDEGQVARLLDWCGPGQTLALLGSSGVGKSTLVNRLTGAGQETRDVREDDAKGRHTTTARSLHALPSGGWLIDTPGMRELQLHDAAEGIAEVFEDIAGLADGCRFADCAHDVEPGCAIRAAIEAGDLDEARVARWRKLEREETRNTAGIAERRAHGRALSRLYRSGQESGKRKRGD